MRFFKIIDATVPRNLRATWYSNTSICLKWDEPLVLTAPILGYEIHWLSSSGNGWDRSVSNNTSHTMKHLAPFVEYSFRVTVVTKTGTGSMSENLDIRTAVGGKQFLFLLTMNSNWECHILSSKSI